MSLVKGKWCKLIFYYFGVSSNEEIFWMQASAIKSVSLFSISKTFAIQSFQFCVLASLTELSLPFFVLSVVDSVLGKSIYLIFYLDWINIINKSFKIMKTFNKHLSNLYPSKWLSCKLYWWISVFSENFSVYLCQTVCCGICLSQVLKWSVKKSSLFHILFSWNDRKTM